MDQITMFRKLTGESDLELLSLLLEMAENNILAYTNRSVLPALLEQTKLDWALVAYNRRGMEGETSRSEGGISSSFAEIPEKIKANLNNYRLARVCGHAYESES